MSRQQSQTIGVILLTFGTAESLDDVPRYLSSVRGGQPLAPELIAEFKRRFARVGGSPLVRITQEQAAALEKELNEGVGDWGSGAGSPEVKESFRVTVGMRHSAPTVRKGLEALSDWGAERMVGIIMSPQFSQRIMGGYLSAVAEASAELGLEERVRVAGAWHQAPAFIDALANRLAEAIERLSPDVGGSPPVLFTAHSLPRKVADVEPGYLDQLRETAEAVARRCGLGPERWKFAYQSAGHTREEWLKPDLVDQLPQLRETGHGAVLVAPVQFLADHLEVLYDIDVAAREQAASLGIELHRTESLNSHPRFIESLAWVVRRELGGQ